LAAKPIIATFDEPHSSSDGGSILLKAADESLGLTRRLASSLLDQRQRRKVRHELRELLGQRVFGIACGYEDCNDAARLSEDPLQKLLVGRHPLTGDRLGSQATLSRFENSVRRTDLYRMGDALADVVIERHRKRLCGRVKRITIDLDPTDAQTHGEQQLAMFNGFYREWCYLPTLGFLTFNDEPEQHAFAALLRPGNASATAGAIGLLRRTIRKLRKVFRRAQIRVRLDAGFATPEVYELLEHEDVEYVIGFGTNKVLGRRTEKWMKQVRSRSKRSGQSEQLYRRIWYRAKGWSCRRRIVVKAEVVRLGEREPRDNPRFVVTNIDGDPEELYMVDYCGRGEIENRIKEAKALHMDRVSCSNFWANQFRILLTLAAFVLMQEIRLRAARTSLARAQVVTLRERLFKLAARVVASARRYVLHLPSSCPSATAWKQIAIAFGGSG
jgi:hypothetical protein